MNENHAVISLVEGDEVVRASLEEVIRNDGYRIQAYSSLAEFMVRASFRGVGCLLFDLMIPGSPGLGLLKTLQASGFQLPVILLSSQSSVPLSIEAMKLGAADFLVKPLEPAMVLQSINEAVEHSQETYRAKLELEVIQSRVALLTCREKEVLREVTAGYLNKQIAQRLGTAEKTIKVHRGRVMKKMQARSVVDLVQMADKLRLTALRDELASAPSGGAVQGSRASSNWRVGAANFMNSN